MLKFLLILLFPSAVFAMVIGADTRELVKTPQGLPYSAVGLVQSFDGKTCTGTLIGRDLVLTAAHCLLREQKLLAPTHVRYHAHYVQGGSSGDMSSVMEIVVSDQGASSGPRDWAILKLEKPLGERFGFLATGTLRSNELHKAFLRVPGYDVTHPISKNYGLSLLVNKRRGHAKAFASNGIILHDVPTGLGSSGGPLLKEENGKWTVVGITVAEIRKGVQCPIFNNRDCHNIAVPQSSWRDALQRLKL